MQTQKTIGIIALLVMAVIYLDHYVLPKQMVYDKIDYMTRDYSYKKPKGYSYLVWTASGTKYYVSGKAYYNLQIGKPVILRMTSLFRKKVTIALCIEKDCTEYPLQGFRDIYTGALLVSIPFIFLLPGLLGFVNISIGRARIIYIFGCVWAVFTIIIFFGS